MTSTATYHSLEGRVVIITGAGQGLGRTYAHHFAQQRAIPVIAEISEKTGKNVEREITDAGGVALSIITDVSDEQSVSAMVDQTLRAFGRIDCLINNAALLQQIKIGPFWELSAIEWRTAIDVNVTGTFLCARGVAPAMQKANWGRIVNVSSPTVTLGRVNYLHYVASKSAMIGMTRAMARELGPWNITVNTFWPGVVMTEVERPSVTPQQFDQLTKMQALKRSGTMEDHARAMLFLCSEDAGYITGQSMQSDGGRSFI